MEKSIKGFSMEEDEDRILLNSLGVTSANPEDIERNILSQVFIYLFSNCNGGIVVYINL